MMISVFSYCTLFGFRYSGSFTQNDNSFPVLAEGSPETELITYEIFETSITIENKRLFIKSTEVTLVLVLPT